MKEPDFWQEKEKAIRISQEFNQLNEEVTDFDFLEIELGETDNPQKIEDFEKKLKEKEVLAFLSGKYDQGNAILSIFSGAGGQDAQDWATMLLRMYERYCQKKGFKTKIFHQSFGEGGGPEGRIGTKQASMEVRGRFAFGLLKKEIGVHRLVRISPFSAKKLRHTSFALVEVVPEIAKMDEADLKVKPEDIKTESYKASGPGGQYVNKRETAVRVIHVLTGLVASSQSERSQAQNKKKALELLYARLYQLYSQHQKTEISKIKGERVSPSWGNQIRNYILQPYKLVKDLKTGLETTKVEEVLNGDLEAFVEAEIKNYNSNTTN